MRTSADAVAHDLTMECRLERVPAADADPPRLSKYAHYANYYAPPDWAGMFEKVKRVLFLTF